MRFALDNLHKAIPDPLPHNRRACRVRFDAALSGVLMVILD